MNIAARSACPCITTSFEVAFDDGTTRCWLGNAVPLFDEAQQSRGAVGAFLDITDRKRAEEKLGAAHAEVRTSHMHLPTASGSRSAWWLIIIGCSYRKLKES